jgi:hypothetical protein
VACYALGEKGAGAGFGVSGEIEDDIVSFDLPYLEDVSFRLP